MFRLEAYDRNCNFGQRTTTEQEYAMSLPSLSDYKDLHADMDIPKVTLNNISTYLHLYNRTVDKAATDLYNDGFVNYVRHAMNSDRHRMYFFRAECRASMKLTVTYIVDVQIDGNGVVALCQCECGAGMGPHAHCKHVISILYGLVKYSEVGEFRTHQTCTQQLQTFHHAKKHNGSPLKAQDVPVFGSSMMDYDPRPIQFRNQSGYTDYVANTCVGSGVMHSAPIAQCIRPANPYAFLADHSYLSSHDHKQRFLQSCRISEISNLEIEEIEKATRGQSMNDRWMAERKKRLSASNFGRICKMTGRTDAVRFAKSLLMRKEISSAAISHGKTYESVAVKKYEESTGISTSECGLYVSSKQPFLCASPDRIVHADKFIEVKCPYSARNSSISTDTVSYLFRTDDGHLTLNQEHEYYYQIQGQLFCTGAQSVDFVIFTFVDLLIVHIARNDDFIDNMVNKLVRFFELYFSAALFDKYIAGEYFEHIVCKCCIDNSDVPGCPRHAGFIQGFLVMRDDNVNANDDDVELMHTE